MKKFAAIFFSVLFACGAGAGELISLERKIELARRLADEAARGEAQAGRVITGDFDFARELKRFKLEPPKAAAVEEYSDITAAAPSAAENNAPSNLPPKPRSVAKPKYVVDTSSDFINGHYTGVVGEEKKMPRPAETKKPEPPKAEKKIFSYSSGMFTITSDDYPAHSTMIYLSGEFEKVFRAYFGAAPGGADKKVWLRVSADETSKEKTRVSVGAGGMYSVYAAWSKGLGFGEFCAAAARACIASAAGVDPKKVPAWLAGAFETAFEQSARFGVVSDAAYLASENPPPAPAEIFAAPALSEIGKAQAYWTLVSLEKAFKDKGALSSFLLLAARGAPADKLAEKLLEIKPRSMEFNLWWSCLITGEIWARMGGVLSPERSAAEIARLAVLQKDAPDGSREGVSGSKIWAQRAALSEEISLRIIEIKVALANVNPLYHNALVSLGRMFEAARDGSESAFGESRDAFVSDFKSAQMLGRETKKMMER